MINQDKGSSLSPVFGVHWLNRIPSLLQHSVKPVLTTTFLKRPPVLNDYVVVLP